MGEGLLPPSAPPLQGDSLVLWRREGGSGVRGHSVPAPRTGAGGGGA